MIALIYGFLTASVLGWYSLVITGLDRETTIAVNTTLARYIICVTSSAFAAIAFGACLMAKKNNRLLVKLRLANRSAWILSALLYASFLTAACVWTTGQMVRTAAQHLPGLVHESSARVTAVWQRGAGRPGCAEEILVNLETSAEQVNFCVEMRWGSRISPDRVMPEDQVRLRLRDTRLGVVVERVDRVAGRP